METSDNLSGTRSAHGLSIDDLFSVGAHFGFSKSRRNPSVKSFIFGTKNGLDIIDLDKTTKAFDKAMDFLSVLSKEGKQVLLVGNKKEARVYTVEAAARIDMPYVAERWIGGTLTNFSELKKRISHLEDLLNKKETGALDIYTKKERIILNKEMSDLTRRFGGIVKMKRLPAALVLIDAKKESIALAEALKVGTPVVAICGSDNDISGVDYPVVANDTSITSIKYFIDKVVEAWRKAKSLS